MESGDFDGFGEVESFTRVIVYKNNKNGGSSPVPYYDLATGYDGNLVNSNARHNFTTTYNSTYAYASDWGSNDASDEAYVSTTIFDGKAFNLSSQVTYNLNGESQSLTYQAEVIS